MSRLGEECRALSEAGIDGIHWDIMDGVAVPALSFGPDVVLACRVATDLPFEAHVMSRMPEGLVEPLAGAGCVSLTIHPDWVEHPRRILQRIADAGMVPGIALSPGTPVEYAEWHLDIAGLVLVMSVEPGFGGQAHVPSMVGKVERINALLERHTRPIVLEVDGGIDATTIAPMKEAGASRGAP
jgi:ribulose-phosphate 3-epimerase